MRFVFTTTKRLEETQQAIAKGYADGDDHDAWESYYVIRTKKGDVSLSTPSSAKNIGIYFQPRAGTGSPVICLHEVAEIHRIYK